MESVDKGKVHGCLFCPAKFKWRADLLRQHLPTHTMEKPYICKKCGREYRLRHHLKNHMEAAHSKKPHVCFLCAKTYKWKANFEAHIRFHLGEKYYECTLCSKRFSTNSQMKQHLLTHDKGDTARVHWCLFCPAKFKWSNHLKQHYATHIMEKPHICKCGCEFMHVQTFKRHVQKKCHVI